MSGPIVVEPKKKRKPIKSVIFKVGGKVYEAIFDKPMDLKKIKLPKGGKKKIDEGFENIAKKHGIKLYLMDVEGNKTPVKKPTEKMLATAGKAYVKRTMVYETVIKKK
jgi:hypothetical protein